jgi:hypothetical protein
MDMAFMIAYDAMPDTSDYESFMSIKMPID